MQLLIESLQNFYDELDFSNIDTTLSKYKSILKLLFIIPFVNAKDVIIFFAVIFSCLVTPILWITWLPFVMLKNLSKTIYNLGLAIVELILQDNNAFDGALQKAKYNFKETILVLGALLLILPVVIIFSPILIFLLLSRVIASTLPRKLINFIYQKYFFDWQLEQELERLNQELQRLNEVIKLNILHKGLSGKLPPELILHIANFLPNPEKAKRFFDNKIPRSEPIVSITTLAPNQKPLDYLWENRHTSSKNQMAFDEQLGLVPLTNKEVRSSLHASQSTIIKRLVAHSLWENRNASPENQEVFDRQYAVVPFRPQKI